MIAIVDNAIPYIKGILEPFLDVIYAPGEAFSSAIEKAGKQEKCLFIRTRTKCDKSLLEGHDVRFIASATIGKDHIDEDYCRANSICVANAPGCNSSAVMQYFLTSISQTGILPESRKDREKLTVGIIGAGNVGEKVARLCLKLGFKVLRNDPPKQAQGIPLEYFSLEEVLENSDIVTIHTPLDSTTRGLAGKHFFDLICFVCIVIGNACQIGGKSTVILSSQKIRVRRELVLNVVRNIKMTLSNLSFPERERIFRTCKHSGPVHRIFRFPGKRCFLVDTQQGPCHKKDHDQTENTRNYRKNDIYFSKFISHSFPLMLTC